MNARNTAKHKVGERIAGAHALEEALSAHVPIGRIYATSAAQQSKRLSRLFALASKAGVDVVRVDASVLDEDFPRGAHQGVAAEVLPFGYVGVADLAKAASGRENALIVACDHVTDAGNLGAILRSAEVVGATGVLIPNRRQARVTAAVYKASAGAVFHLPVAMEANLASTLQRLKDEGFWVVGASEHATDAAWDVELGGRIVLVVGSEDAGLSRLVAKTCDMLVCLPQAGRVESLNVAQATTVLAYEWMRQCSADAS